MLGSRNYFVAIFAAGIAFRISKVFQILSLYHLFKPNYPLIDKNNFEWKLCSCGPRSMKVKPKDFILKILSEIKKKLNWDKPGQNFHIPMTLLTIMDIFKGK